ncbi:hypothetical protein Trichorick_01064 [Candidatus Trichorickettsia mobilis]|uniref:Uncharacterized protein n=1 Tax=Candidatus Trichorickettsia mobilis TaxID=1346319 RepID=A0ABZ0USZ7_9RICK|nr:hypothetical protein [Candidatus Trichorickettsia mobilis]WPY01160.1 hypothetical protein Trichorick_01064 [Candidatus Trichorickettsia mobilis]
MSKETIPTIRITCAARLIYPDGTTEIPKCRQNVSTSFNKPSKPSFIVDNVSIGMFDNKPREYEQFVKPLDYSPYRNLPTSYQPTVQQSSFIPPFEFNLEAENEEFSRLGAEKYQARL